jgi:hypothetical protein
LTILWKHDGIDDVNYAVFREDIRSNDLCETIIISDKEITVFLFHLYERFAHGSDFVLMSPHLLQAGCPELRDTAIHPESNPYSPL